MTFYDVTFQDYYVVNSNVFGLVMIAMSRRFPNEFKATVFLVLVFPVTD